MGSVLIALSYNQLPKATSDRGQQFQIKVNFSTHDRIMRILKDRNVRKPQS